MTRTEVKPTTPLAPSGGSDRVSRSGPTIEVEPTKFEQCVTPP